jgi:hypothetical protein
MKTFGFNLKLNMSQVIQLRSLTGACNSFTEVYEQCSDILKQHRITPVILSDFCRLDNLKFQNACDIKASGFNRTTVTVGGKKYYEDELATALANIKEVK